MNRTVSLPFLVMGIVFCVCLICSNLLEVKMVSLGGITATAGLIVFPISYIINDCIAEVWGYRKARLIIWYGFLMNFVAVAVFRLSILVPGSGNFHQQEAFALVLGNTTRITVASFVAFLFGSFLNAYVMSRLKILQHGRGFSLRAIASTVVGEGADSLVFFTIAFGGVLPVHDLLMLILTQIGMKTAYEVIALPLTNRLVKWVKRKEHTDVYDTDISYKPWKVRDI